VFYTWRIAVTLVDDRNGGIQVVRRSLHMNDGGAHSRMMLSTQLD
jgi:hypothetical protein